MQQTDPTRNEIFCRKQLVQPKKKKKKTQRDITHVILDKIREIYTLFTQLLGNYRHEAFSSCLNSLHIF